MARKKKQTRKQRVEDQRAAIARKRAAENRPYSPGRAKSHQAEVAADMAPLFSLINSTTSSEDEQMEQIYRVLLENGELAEEPEFEDFIFDPVQCLEVVNASEETFGLDPLDLANLPEDEQEPTQVKMMAHLIKQVLTPAAQKEILDRLDRLRLRLKRRASPQKTAQVAALQSYLMEHPHDPIWSANGLVWALFMRTLSVGLDYMKQQDDIFEQPLDEVLDEVFDEAGSGNLLAFSERLAESSLVKNIERVAGKIPGLRKFFEKEVDDLWEKGLQALYHREFSLDIFSDEELQAGHDLIQHSLDEVQSSETDDEAESPAQALGRKLVLNLNAYLTEMLTPTRVDQIRAHLRAMLEQPTHPPKWGPFVLMAFKRLEDEEAVQYEKPLFLHAFVGEILLYVAKTEAEDTEEVETGLEEG